MIFPLIISERGERSKMMIILVKKLTQIISKRDVTSPYRPRKENKTVSIHCDKLKEQKLRREKEDFVKRERSALNTVRSRYCTKKKTDIEAIKSLGAGANRALYAM
jgi:hypothetical protein